MAQLIVRNLQDNVKTGLQQRAARNGRSMEEEVRTILRDAVESEIAVSQEGLGTQLARTFAGLDFDFDIPELRGEEVRPAEFGDDDP